MRSIKSAVTRRLVIWFTLVFTLSGATIFFVVGRVLTKGFDLKLEAKARALISVTEFEDGELEIDLETTSIPNPLAMPDVYQIFDSAATSYYRSRSLGDHDLLDPGTSLPGNDTYRESFFHDGELLRLGLTWFRPLDDNTGMPTDPFLLVVGSSSRELKRSIASIGLVVLATSLVALAATIPIVVSSLRSGLTPASNLAAETANLGPEDLAHRFETDGLPIEILPVGQKLNSLLARLDESFERERRFSSNASHELRNPLAEIRTIAEMATKWPEEATSENFAQVLAIAVDMQKLVEHLVLLARTDSGNQRALRQSFDFGALIRDAIARRDAAAQVAQVEVIAEIQPGVMISDPIIWGLIAGNLLDNAIRYTPKGTAIQITASPGKLEISNPAPQLTPDDLRNITERFWRKEDSSPSYGHSGLGLALVKGLTGSLDATFEAELDSDSDRLVVRVRETALI